MLLGTRSLAAGDIRKYEIDYRPYLCYGNKLSTVSVTVSADALSTVDTVTIYSAETIVSFMVNAAAVNETFTASIEATMDDGEVLNDTADFIVT